MNRPVLDPTTWDRDERERYLNRGLDRHDEDGAIGTGTRALVLGSTGPFAQLAGRKALEAGGSATDAVITTALTQIALAAGGWVSYAGVFHLTHYEAAANQDDRVTSLSAGFATFAAEDDPASIPKPPVRSGRTTLVPGFVAGVRAAHDRFGALPWAELFGPARYIAERGLPIGRIRAAQFGMRRAVLPEAFHVARGDTFRQPELAATLRELAENGADWMYRGPWAEEFVDVVGRAGGRAALEDLAAYRPVWARPLHAHVHGHDIHTLGLPDKGGATLLEMLRATEGAGDPLTDPRALVELIAATRRAVRPGNHSDFVLAVDAEGNVASAAHSINTSLWGSTALFVGGVSIPDAASFQQGLLATLGPGDHVPFPSNPAIVLRDGRPVLASSSIGAALHAATLQCLHAVLGLGVGVDEAVRRPLFHGPDYLSGDGSGKTLQERITGDAIRTRMVDAARRAREAGVSPERLFETVMAGVPQVIEDGFAADVLAGAEPLGQRLDVRPVGDAAIPRGYWGGIAIGERLVGGRTPVSGGTVEGL